jgi:NAD(P)-dependent dehydrogenase (short-subunit alcohol dehydrogenase family)
MKILIIGASGTIGQAIVKELEPRHELIRVGKSRGNVQVDITDPRSIRAMYERVGRVDSVVSACGNVHFGPLSDMTPELYDIGLKDKLMGQVNLVLLGREFVNDGGSFTLTSGVVSWDPIRYGSSASMVNGALEAFTRAAALELPRGLRINTVSPTVIQESLPSYGPYFRGFEAVPAARAALAYSKSVEGAQTGQVYRVP